MENWIVNPDGVGARNLITGTRTRIIVSCSRCQRMGYDWDSHTETEVSTLLGHPAALPHVSADISGNPICDDCWSGFDRETESYKEKENE
mgnify:CR=1 FL=1